MDAQSVKVKLLAQIVPVLEHLFPEGVVKGKIFYIGNIEGEKGNSLHVMLDGEAAGGFKDHATGETGDIYTLWMKSRNISFVDALDQAKRFLGITEVRKVMESKPKGYDNKVMGSMSGTPAHKYLNDRGISDQTLKRYKVRIHPDATNPAYAFQYMTCEGERAHVKYCSLARDDRGRKKIWSTPPFPTLWGWWTVTPHDRSVIITEGEIDAMTLYQMNPDMPVMSMHSGTGNLNWIDNDYHALNQFETIYLVTDRDDAGDKCAEEVSKRLGQARVMRVPIPMPYNDVNDAFMSGDERMVEWTNLLEKAYFYTPETIRKPSSFVKEAKRYVAKAKKEKEHNTFMFPSVPFAYRDGETTIVSGEPGHGKSDWLYQSHIHEMHMGKKVMICSLEIPPAKMLAILVQQKVGGEPTDEQIDTTAKWLDEKMVYHSGKSPRGADFSLKWEELLDDMEYAYRRYGITRFVIDSLHFLVMKDDYEKQDKITVQLQQFNLNHNTHTALVAHSNLKGRKEGSIPSRHDVEGSGGMIKPIDNGITIWRHEEKQSRVQDPDKYDTTLEKAEALHDGVMKIWKQRETGDHGTWKMYFDKGSRTFRMQSYGMKHFFSRTTQDEEKPELEQGEF
jgi:twinkle protein